MSETIIDLSHQTLKNIAQIISIKKEIITLESEKKVLEVKSEIEEKDFTNELEEINSKISSLKSKLEEYKTIDHPILAFNDKKRTIKKRLDKLEEKKGTIDPSIYVRLQNEYLNELNALISTIDKTKEELTKIIETTKASINKNKLIKEELMVRKEIEEISDSEITSKINSLNEKIRSDEELFNIVKQLLEMINSYN